MVCLPVVTPGRTLGAIGLTFEDARALDDEEAHFLLLIARYCGQALERLRLLAVEQQNRVRAELLYKLAAAVISAGRVEEIFEAALDAIAQALGTDRASVLLFDAEGVMRFRAWRNLSDPYRAAVEGHSPWAPGARNPQPIVSGDVETDPAMACYLPLFKTEQIGALAFIPLVGGGHLIGKFMVYYTRPRELSSQELELALRHRQPCRRRRAAVSLAGRAAADRPLQRDVRRHPRPRSAQPAGRHHHLGAPGDEPGRDRPAAKAAVADPLQQRPHDAHDRSAARLHARAPGRRNPAGSDRARSRSPWSAR